MDDNILYQTIGRPLLEGNSWVITGRRSGTQAADLHYPNQRPTGLPGGSPRSWDDFGTLTLERRCGCEHTNLSLDCNAIVLSFCVTRQRRTHGQYHDS